MQDIVIVSAARTAVGKFGGSLSKISAPELGGLIIKEVVARAGIDAALVGEVIMGQVLAAGAGQNPARQALMKAGLPKEIPGLTINAVCGSGLKAVMLAAQAVAFGDSDIVIAGGQENMSLSPHVAHLRAGTKMGDRAREGKSFELAERLDKSRKRRERGAAELENAAAQKRRQRLLLQKQKQK